MSEEMQTIDGVLLLVDLCGSTPAQAEHGSPAFQGFRDPIRSALIKLEKSTGFRLLEDQGDGFMLFRLHRLNDTHAALLDLFAEMQRLSPELSTGKFDCALRFVAHYSGFQAAPDADGFPRNIQSIEAVRVFRAEKLAAPGDLLVTHELMSRLGEIPERRNLSIERIRLGQPLKGLELLGAATTVFYRLRLPRHADALDLQFPPLYRKRRQSLGAACREIPVFGRVYAPIPMDGNFIQLKLDNVSHRPGSSDYSGFRISKYSELHRERRLKDDGAFDFEKPLTENSRFKPEDLEAHFSHGIILGLPGAGKTTILRYLVHRSLQKEATTVLLLAASGDLTNAHAELCPYDDGATYTAQGALRLLLSVFLWPGDLVKTLDHSALGTATHLFHAAWQADEGTVLIDALDEALSDPLRQRIIHAAKVLFRSILGEKSSRIFLTARRQFRAQLDLEGFRVFEIEPLDLGDLSQLSRSVFDPIGKRQTADRFVAELPNHPAAVRLGGTPMTALLLLFFFEATGGWSSRFGIYDAVLRFVLLKVWEKAKKTPGITTLREFFAATSDADFSQRFPAAGTLYDALAATGFHALFGEDPEPLRRLTRDDLLHYFSAWISAHPQRQGLPAPKNLPSTQPETCMAAAWFDELFTAGLFLPTDAGHFVFIHSTVLEFLAARHLADAPEAEWPAALANPGRDLLETFPMLCSRDWRIAHRILGLLPRHVAGYQPDSVLAFSCLAEAEDAEMRELDRFNAEAHRRPLREQMDGAGPKESIFHSLAAILWSMDAEFIGKATASYLSLLPLTRDTWPSRFTRRGGEWWSQDHALREARSHFLKAILHRELHEKYIEEPLRPKVVEPPTRPSAPLKTSIPATEQDSAYLGLIETYRGEDLRQSILALREALPASSFVVDFAGDDLDQNLAYYRASYSPAISGFFGSPNFRTAGIALSVAVSPNGRLIASGDGSGKITLWDAATGREISFLIGHLRSVLSCAWHPDGKILASASADQSVRLWEASTGREIRSFNGHSNWVRSCAWHPDGQTLASASDDQSVRLWDTASGREIRSLTGHSGSVLSCAWHPDGKTLASASADKTIHLWDAATGLEIRSLSGHSGSVSSCAWHRDGKTLASASADKTIRLWDAATGREVRSLTGHLGEVNSCAWHPDGETLASASDDQSIRLWDATSGREIRFLIGHSKWVWSCAWHPDGETLASASSDQSIRLWESATGREISSHNGQQGSVTSCAWHPDGKILASASDDQSVRLWDAATGGKIHSLWGHSDRVQSCSWHPSGKILASSSDDQTVRLWDAASGLEIRALTGHSDWVRSCAWHPDGKTLASASDDESVCLWDTASGREIRSLIGHSGSVLSCAWHPDGKTLASASADQTVRIWDVATGREIRSLSGHSKAVLCCAWHPDGKTLASASDDKSVRLWNAATGREIRSFSGHSGSVPSCAWHPDGKTLASASADQTVRLWNTANGNEIQTISLPAIPLSLAFHPKRPHLLAAALINGTTVILDLSPH